MLRNGDSPYSAVLVASPSYRLHHQNALFPSVNFSRVSRNLCCFLVASRPADHGGALFYLKAPGNSVSQGTDEGISITPQFFWRSQAFTHDTRPQ